MMLTILVATHSQSLCSARRNPFKGYFQLREGIDQTHPVPRLLHSGSCCHYLSSSASPPYLYSMARYSFHYRCSSSAAMSRKLIYRTACTVILINHRPHAMSTLYLQSVFLLLIVNLLESMLQILHVTKSRDFENVSFSPILSTLYECQTGHCRYYTASLSPFSLDFVCYRCVLADKLAASTTRPPSHPFHHTSGSLSYRESTASPQSTDFIVHILVDTSNSSYQCAQNLGYFPNFPS